MSTSAKAVVTKTGTGQHAASYPCAGGASIQCVTSGTVTYNVEWSNDNTNWIVHDTISGATADASGAFNVPVVAFRVNVTAGTGTATVTIKGKTNQ